MNNSYNPSPQDLDYNNPPITLKDIIGKINRARSWIISSSLIILLGTIYVTYSTPPIYQATASVLIETSNRAQRIFNYSRDNSFNISNEIAVIKSRTVAEDVVKSLWNSNMRNRLYIFGTKIFMPRGQRLRRPIKKILSLGKWSPEQSQPPRYDEEYSGEIGQRFYQNILNSLMVYIKRGTNIIQISVSSPHPYEAVIIANTIVTVYQKWDKEWSSNESTSLESFLSKRLKDKESELDSISVKIEKYKRENKIYSLNGNVDNLLANLTGSESNYFNNILEIKILSNNKDYLLEKLSATEKELADQILNSVNIQLFSLRNQMDEKEEELIKNSMIYGSDHEAVINSIQQLEDIKSQLEIKTQDLINQGLSVVDPVLYRQELITEILVKEVEISNLVFKSQQNLKLINKYDSLMQKIPEKQMFLSKLEREKTVLSSSYTYMRQKMEEARVSSVSEPGKVRIINMATIPNSPISPDIFRNIIMALIIGSLLGFGISISIEYFDTSIRSLEYAEGKNMPILAIIPSIGKELLPIRKNKFFTKIMRKNKTNYKNGKKTIGDLQRRMVTHENPRSPISEAYRSLRTSLMYTRQGEMGSMMISSPGPGEGKTTTIINLAITYANLGKKTILVDGDLRKPVIHKVFNGSNDIGLTHYLSGIEKKMESIIYSSDIENLDIIYNGAIPPNPSELLGSELMKDLVLELKEIYDVVLFDAPPIMAVTDAVVLSRLTDQFILVVRFGNTSKDSIDHTLNIINQVGTTLTGVVFNDLNQKNSYYSKSYYSYNQYYVSAKNII